MSKTTKSGPAIFMYSVIALTVITAAVCFVLHYGNILHSGVILWTGITAFTIMYHFWVRIIMGNVSKLFTIHHKQKWFKERAFEKPLYKFLRVKKWKNKVLTYNPDSFSLKKHSLEEIADTMAKSEVDHWINELISLSTILFALLWGQFWLFFATALLAMIFDAQFIIVQRFNRPFVLKVMNRQNRRKANKNSGN